jgi:hypothetical protein
MALDTRIQSDQNSAPADNVQPQADVNEAMLAQALASAESDTSRATAIQPVAAAQLDLSTVDYLDNLETNPPMLEPPASLAQSQIASALANADANPDDLTATLSPIDGPIAAASVAPLPGVQGPGSDVTQSAPTAVTSRVLTSTQYETAMNAAWGTPILPFDADPLTLSNFTSLQKHKALNANGRDISVPNGLPDVGAFIEERMRDYIEVSGIELRADAGPAGGPPAWMNQAFLDKYFTPGTNSQGAAIHVPKIGPGTSIPYDNQRTSNFRGAANLSEYRNDAMDLFNNRFYGAVGIPNPVPRSGNLPIDSSVGTPGSAPGASKTSNDVIVRRGDEAMAANENHLIQVRGAENAALNARLREIHKTNYDVPMDKLGQDINTAFLGLPGAAAAGTAASLPGLKAALATKGPAAAAAAEVARAEAAAVAQAVGSAPNAAAAASAAAIIATTVSATALGITAANLPGWSQRIANIESTHRNLANTELQNAGYPPVNEYGNYTNGYKYENPDR